MMISRKFKPASFVRQAVSLSLLALTILTTTSFAQDLPKSIRGYKVHRDKITVSTARSEEPTDASVRVGEPVLIEAGLTGVTFELPAEVLSAKQSAKVDLLTFRDVKVNGVSVEVKEYSHPFLLKKGETVALPKPARIFLPATGMMQAAWSEMRDSKEDWTVTGRVFVFGKFRKFGIYHKRVVPVDFEVKIKNPLRSN